MRHPVPHLGLAPLVVAPLAGPDAPSAAVRRLLAPLVTAPLAGPDAPTAVAVRRLAPVVAGPLADPLAVVTVGGWVVALAALAAALVLWRGHDRRLALVAEAAHELRGPLSAALLGLHGLMPDAAGARRVAAVELELRRAGLALADLDAAPRGRRAPQCAEPVDVRALLAEAVEAWRPVARSLASELLFDPAGQRAVVAVDRLRLTQAVGNLVLNALEHGAGPVRLRVHATRTRVRIEVRDHGPGLPAPVAALSEGSLHAGRRGHGLAIAARVVRRHGGRLLTAPVSSGSCVVLELPRADLAPRAPLGRRPRRARARW
jgi:signal transduction histidine kinase